MAVALAIAVPAAFMPWRPAHGKGVEEQIELPVSVQDAYGKRIEHRIAVTLFSDDAVAGPKPVIVINHGRAGEATERAAMGRARYAEASRWFARQGFIVALPTRLGYGVSGGEDVEDTGACNRKNYPPGYAAAAAQVIATLDAVRARPDAAKDRSVVLGQSYGGATVIAVAARMPPGVVAAINFAGGGGGDPKARPRQPCSPPQLERLFAGYGATARMPTLWIYAENDLYWGPSLPRSWFDAYRAAGGVGEFVQVPPHGEDGHQFFGRFVDAWKPTGAGFLRKQGFEIRE